MPAARRVHRLSSQMAQAAAGRPDLVRQAALATGQELAAVGITSISPPWPTSTPTPKTRASDPFLRRTPGRRGPAFGRRHLGYESAGVICTPKHFPGHGDTAVDSHVGCPGWPRRGRLDGWISPLPGGLRRRGAAVMTAHVQARPGTGRAAATLSGGSCPMSCAAGWAFPGPSSPIPGMGAVAAT